MKLTIRIFIQKHENRSYTVMAPLFPGVAAYGPTLEECKQEVAEALALRLAEVDPDALHAYSLPPNQELERVTVELRPTDRHGKRRRDSLKLAVSLMLTPEEDGQILVSTPRLRHPPLSFYITSRGELHEVAQLELAQYFHGDSLETLLGYQAARYESLDTLQVEFKPKKATDKLDEEDEESFWALKQSGTNLTAQAAEGQLRRAFRREREVTELLQALASERRPSTLLVGPSGAGKTAIAHEVARRIRRKECPEALAERQVWAVTADSLIAGCSFIGQWQEKLGDLVREVRKKRHILFVEDLAGLAEAGRWSKGDDNMADFLKPFIQSGDVVVIGESTPERLQRAERLAPGFMTQFRTLDVLPTGDTDTLSLLSAVARELERLEQLRIEPAALEAAVELTNRFMPYRAQPGKAVALIEQIAGAASAAGTSASATIGRREVIGAFGRQSGLPEFIISDTTALDLPGVRDYFADRIVGQDEAVDAMVDLIATVKAGLSDPDKPLGTFLFIGPTGVGKTQLAKTLAKYLFGDERRVLRFDMSEYADPAGIRRLIGVPGMGGEASEGDLTRRVRAQPFCVLLLDEFEKADSSIYDIFLQVLGEGRLTDASGHTTSFQNAIILLTSNLGASAREQRPIGLAGADAGERSVSVQSHSFNSSYWQRKVEEHFRPEFVNRLDRIVVFTPLDVPAMRRIATRELGEVLLREGLTRRNVLVEIDPNVIDLLIDQGFTATYGARPLKRAIERLIVLPLARFLAGRSNPGADLLRLRRENDQIVLHAASITTAERTAAVTHDDGAPTGTLDLGLSTRRLDDHGLAAAFANLRRKLDEWAERDAVVEMRNERATKLAETNKPTFWDDGDLARATMARFYFLDRLLKRLQQLTDRAEYLEELSGLVHRQRDVRYRTDLAEGYSQLERDVAFLEVELLCAHLAENHRAVLLLRRVGPPTREDGDEPWAVQLAAMYLRWARRKGYEIELFQLEPLPENERRGTALTAQHYPYRWKGLDTSDIDVLIKRLAALDDTGELAIGLEGANVYGFLRSEAGLHRRSDKKPSGERIQRMAEVTLATPGSLTPRAWLEMLLLQRAMREQEASQRPARKTGSQPVQSASFEPEVIRVYQVEGERLVRDLRTQQKTTDISTVLAGGLDPFILAYLRETEQKIGT